MIKLLMYSLVISGAVLFVAKVFGLLSASWLLVLTPWIITAALVAISVFLVAVVFND